MGQFEKPFSLGHWRASRDLVNGFNGLEMGYEQ